MLNFWKSLAYQLKENTYLEQEEIQQHRRSTRIQDIVGHGLVLLPAFRKVLDGCMVKSVSRYPPQMLSMPPRSMNLLQVHSWCLLVL